MVANVHTQERSQSAKRAAEPPRQLDELQLLRTAAQSRALMRAGMAVLTELDEQVLLSKGLEAAWSLVRADLTAFFLAGEHESELQLRALRTAQGQHVPTQSEAPLISLSEEAVARGCQLEVQDPREVLIIRGDGYVLPRLRQAFTVPLEARGQRFGVLAVGKVDTGPFRCDHVEMLRCLANQVALALDNARRIKRALLESQYGRQLLENVADALLVVDGELRIVHVNPAAAALAGRPPARLRGRPVAEAFGLSTESGAPLPLEVGPFSRALREGKVITERVLLEPGRGRPAVPVTVSVAPAKGPDARAAYVVGLFHDLSREKRVERMKTEFVSVASHEIRTPLTALQGFTELLLSREVSPDVQRNWLSLMNEESTRLARLIEELLDLTRVESGRVALQAERVSMHDLVGRVVALMETHAKAPRFEVSVPDDLPEITADPGKLTQVLANLLSNAINYAPAGSCVRIRARPACLAPPGIEHLGSLPGDEGVACPAGISVAVADQGMGITPRHLRRIFEPFYRVRANEGQAPSGTGLGLAIAKAVVERHGGRMWVESCPGKGSVFGFCLPLEEGPRHPSEGDQRSASGPSSQVDRPS